MRDNTHKVTNRALQDDLRRLCDEWLTPMDDPILEAQAAGWLLDVFQTDLVPHVSSFRVRSVRRLRSQGFTLAEIGAELGLSRARIDRIANA